jgi:hypothetical protein
MQILKNLRGYFTDLRILKDLAVRVLAERLSDNFA